MSRLDLESHAGSTGWRRLVTFVPALALTGLGVWMMATALGGNGLTWAEIGLLVLFAITFGWIALSFWAAVLGFVLMALGRHPVTLARVPPGDPTAQLTRRVAVLMPIYNEDTDRVFAGMLATYRSVERTRSARLFDFFVISDTTDPEIGKAEEAALDECIDLLGSEARLFYRRRPQNIGRKAGNIADWVRAHGAIYESMIVLDADSVMTGEAMITLAALMEANPRTGIIQTLTVPASRETLFARALQFASRLYGPVLATGQSFWQLGHANYFGHNAIIRVKPFAEHCMLPKLPGAPPLGGEILSHDFVEAAFIRRAGWYVWLLPELAGSFEQVPSNLIDYAARDRRWVQGNLQHLRLMGAARHWVGRLHLGMGVMAFAAAPLWFLLLLLTSGVVVHEAVVGHAYFPAERVLFPIWPDYRPEMTYALLYLTGAVLLGPKLLSLVLALAHAPSRRAFGGGAAMTGSALVELAFSVLVAPVLMMLHTRFIATILSGSSVGWGPQPRTDQAVTWATAFERHWLHTLTGLVWAGLMYRFAPDFLPWVLPVVLGLALSIPVNVISSRASVGRLARRVGVFRTPEETRPPQELVFASAVPRRSTFPAD